VRRALLALLLCALSALAAAQVLTFRDEAEESRFRALTTQLRCVMCQNQSLADSNAPIAQDLRAEVLRLMRDGKSDDEIKQYLVERYTEFVLYKPKVEPTTWLLWFGPALVILAGAGVIAGIVRRKAKQAPDAPPPLDSQEW
jgi:cytochrome c-type biogenesis protein CcmH